MEHHEVREARRRISQTRHAAFESAIQSSASRNYRKGDKVFLVSTGADLTSARVWAREVQLQSLGARQGTATYVADGLLIQTRIWRGSSLLLSTREEVEAFAASYGPLIHTEHLLGLLDCDLANLPNVLPQYRPKADAGIARLEELLKAGPKVSVSYS